MRELGVSSSVFNTIIAKLKMLFIKRALLQRTTSGDTVCVNGWDEPTIVWTQKHETSTEEIVVWEETDWHVMTIILPCGYHRMKNQARFELLEQVNLQ